MDSVASRNRRLQPVDARRRSDQFSLQGQAMTALDSVPSHRPSTTVRPVGGQLELALASALQRSLTLGGAPAPLNPAVLKPLKLLPRNMLLVGKDLPRQKSALELLASSDIPAEIATSGADALQIASTREFDLILIDANKSVLDGVYVSSRLRHLERAQHKRAAVALVARVSGDWPAGESVLRMAGVNDVLKVATEGAAVGECLRRWCSGHYKASLN
jgi:CheY-like chemotaxis protein